jgi:ABC-type nitrate/sulfonate/bicarbonate transport system substrate-binding protein
MTKTVTVLGIIAAIVLVGFGTWYLMNSPAAGPATPEPVTIGTAPVELAGLIYIADDRGFFRQNGLNVTIKDYDSALSAVSGMESGEADISVSTEYPIAADIFRSENISIIGTIDKYGTTYLVGMKDRGIQSIPDFAGKKIGVSHGSIGEFYLGRFLNLHGLDLKDVTLADVKPAQIERALAGKSIDAAVIWTIDPETVEEQFGSNAVIWPAQSSQLTFGIMTGRSTWIDEHEAATGKLLHSIDDAEQYAVNHPTEARGIVQRRLNATDAHMAAVWPQHHLSLTLDQSLVTAMEDEGRWMIANNMTEEKTVPDFMEFINTKSLERIKPGAVRIIG